MLKVKHRKNVASLRTDVPKLAETFDHFLTAESQVVESKPVNPQSY